MKGNNFFCILLLLEMMSITATPVMAIQTGLYNWAFSVDGLTYEQQLDSTGNPINSFNILPEVFDVDSFDQSTGLGTISWTTSGSGAHTFIAFFDHEIDEMLNTYFNEFGTTNGNLSTGQSWEIDEPGQGSSCTGDIYLHVSTEGLDNKNFNGNKYSADDVSMAMGWNFILTPDEIATVSLILSDIRPSSGFYISQTDPETGAIASFDYSPQYTIYFSSTLRIQPSTPVPVPPTIFLMGMGLTGLVGIRIKRK